MRSVPTDATAVAHFTDRVFEVANTYVVIMGEILEEARLALGREGYEHWVAETLPFNLSTADRYRAVYLAHTHLPEAPLPAAHHALYALGHGDLPEQREGPCRSASELAAELLRYDVRELSGHLRVTLEVWLVGDH